MSKHGLQCYRLSMTHNRPTGVLALAPPKGMSMTAVFQVISDARLQCNGVQTWASVRAASKSAQAGTGSSPGMLAARNERPFAWLDTMEHTGSQITDFTDQQFGRTCARRPGHQETPQNMRPQLQPNKSAAYHCDPTCARRPGPPAGGSAHRRSPSLCRQVGEKTHSCRPPAHVVDVHLRVEAQASLVRPPAVVVLHAIRVEGGHLQAEALARKPWVGL